MSARSYLFHHKTGEINNMRVLMMIAALVVCSMLMLACGAFGPKKDDDMMRTPSVNVPLNMANADDDAAIESDLAHTISIVLDGDIFVAKYQYPFDVLPDVLTARSKDNFSGTFYLKGDFNVQWSKVVGVLDAIRKSGSSKVALIVAKGPSDHGKVAYGRLQLTIPPEPKVLSRLPSVL